MADGAWEITNAVREVYGGDFCVRLMCWSHKDRAYKLKLKSLRKENLHEFNNNLVNSGYVLSRRRESGPCAHTALIDNGCEEEAVLSWWMA